MAGVMVAWCWRASAISARPVRAAEPRRSISSDDGGPGTGSSSVRRSRFSRGAFADVPAWPGAGLCLPPVLLFKLVVLARVPAWPGAGFRLAAAGFLLFGIIVLADVRTWLDAGFRLGAAGF